MTSRPAALAARAARAFRSPLRGPWFTSVLAVVLLVGVPVLILTGFVSCSAYAPWLDGQGRPAGTGVLGRLAVELPTRPVWLYRLSQGLHVGLGLVLVPVVLAKLWSVLPRLLAWPPVRSVAQALERLTLLLLVGGILFEIVTGVLNAQLFYPWPFDFYTAHYYGAWVLTGAFVGHVLLKLPAMRPRAAQPLAAPGAADPAGRDAAGDPAARGGPRARAASTRRRRRSRAAGRWPPSAGRGCSSGR